MSFTVFRYTNHEEPAWVFLSTEKHGIMIEMLRKGDKFSEVEDEIDLAELKTFTELSTRLRSNTWQVIMQHSMSNEEQEYMVSLLAESSPKEFITFIRAMRK